MPYKQGARLPGERASRLGHLDVLKSDLVNKLVEGFEKPYTDDDLPGQINWEPIDANDKPLNIIFGVDGSLVPIEDDTPPYRALAFVKTALLRIDQTALAKIDQESPNPFALKDILTKAALYHATVFPLRNVRIDGTTNYHAIRKIIFDSLKDPTLDGQPYETLKWIAYEKWDNNPKRLPLFECPHCEETLATLDFDADEGNCNNCNGHLYLTDMLGFHQNMIIDAAPNSIASDYMGVHETLLLFTAIRHFWQTNPEILKNCLFVKDGPLSIRAQYSKLVAPIRRFLQFANGNEISINLVGQEKTGAFVDHFDLIGRNVPANSIFIPGNQYIKEKIQHRPNRGAAYGKDTNYGAKIFIKLDEYTRYVLTIPTGKFNENPVQSDILGINKILSTLPKIQSSRYEGGLLPVELAHGIASLSTYPSARILKIFAGE
ncbi:MAG: hypothetical protein OEZ02_10685 [Anaerolineae bacterium]|nr:hypothetical protein [Anaerolineae bacterium]